MSKYSQALPDGGEHGGVGAHGVGAHPGLADVEETAAEEGRHAEMICQDCQKSEVLQSSEGCLVCLSKRTHFGERMRIIHFT